VPGEIGVVDRGKGGGKWRGDVLILGYLSVGPLGGSQWPANDVAALGRRTARRQSAIITSTPQARPLALGNRLMGASSRRQRSAGFILCWVLGRLGADHCANKFPLHRWPAWIVVPEFTPTHLGDPVRGVEPLAHRAAAAAGGRREDECWGCAGRSAATGGARRNKKGRS